jgi:hypothetical protein
MPNSTRLSTNASAMPSMVACGAVPARWAMITAAGETGQNLEAVLLGPVGALAGAAQFFQKLAGVLVLVETEAALELGEAGEGIGQQNRRQNTPIR